MFAIVTGGEIYLKGDAETTTLFTDAGSRPFTFQRNGKPVATSYWSMPPACFDDPDEFARFANAALAAAHRKPRRGHKSRHGHKSRR